MQKFIFLQFSQQNLSIKVNKAKKMDKKILESVLIFGAFYFQGVKTLL